MTCFCKRESILLYFCWWHRQPNSSYIFFIIIIKTILQTVLLFCHVHSLTKSIVRCRIRTYAHNCGPDLESGALTNSANLTSKYNDLDQIYKQKCLSEVGFEPTPSVEDRNTLNLCHSFQKKVWNLECGALDHSAILTWNYWNFVNLSVTPNETNAQMLSYYLSLRLVKCLLYDCNSNFWNKSV